MTTSRLFLSLALSLIVSACTGTPTLEEKPSSEFVGLNKVSSSGFKEAWARPGAKLSSFSSVQVSTLESANAQIVQPDTARRISQQWELTPERQQALDNDWQNAMRSAAREQGLATGEGGDKTLRVDAVITRIAPSANLQQEQNSPGRTTVYTEDSGDASIEFKLYDAASNELLAVIRDNRRVGNQMWGRSNTVTASADVRRLFNSWANQLLSRISGN